jgi:hypothetical protein
LGFYLKEHTKCANIQRIQYEILEFLRECTVLLSMALLWEHSNQITVVSFQLVQTAKAEIAVSPNLSNGTTGALPLTEKKIKVASNR